MWPASLTAPGFGDLAPRRRSALVTLCGRSWSLTARGIRRSARLLGAELYKLRTRRAECSVHVPWVQIRSETVPVGPNCWPFCKDDKNDGTMTIAKDHDSCTEAVRDAATRFRAAFEQGGLRLHSLVNFPKGSCGDASEMLGQYLSDSDLGTWSYRSGTQSDLFATHAWVERNDMIVDITADQFADISEPVIVTADRTWHDTRFPSGPSRNSTFALLPCARVPVFRCHGDRGQGPVGGPA